MNERMYQCGMPEDENHVWCSYYDFNRDIQCKLPLLNVGESNGVFDRVDENVSDFHIDNDSLYLLTTQANHYGISFSSQKISKLYRLDLRCHNKTWNDITIEKHPKYNVNALQNCRYQFL